MGLPQYRRRATEKSAVPDRPGSDKRCSSNDEGSHEREQALSLRRRRIGMTQPRKFYFFAFLAAAFLLLPVRAAAQSATVTDDATIQLSSPTTNNGSSSNLGVQGPNLQEASVRFDLSVLPSGLQAANINKATLRLFLSNVSVGGTLTLGFANF